MARELPMFEPASSGHHGRRHAETIAMGGLGPGAPTPLRRHPDWIKSRLPSGDNYHDLKALLRGLNLNTVCEEAHCPNIGECWDQRTATIMILGDTCTRACGFCDVKTGRPTWFDDDEPRRVAEAVAAMRLEHVVVTSVARDDLPDGGAAIFAETILQMRERSPGMGIEVLIPDFDGSDDRLQIVMEARPDILNHNLETVKRLQKPVRKRARWDRSLYVLRRAKEMAVEIGYAVHTKSSLMVGLGETRDELTEAFEALRAVDVDILTVGQYLRPSEKHLPLERYYHPDEFAEMKAEALALGFKHVESARSCARATTRATRCRARSSRPCAAARRPSTPRAGSSRWPGRAELHRPDPRPARMTRASVVWAGRVARRSSPRHAPPLPARIAGRPTARGRRPSIPARVPRPRGARLHARVRRRRRPSLARTTSVIYCRGRPVRLPERGRLPQHARRSDRQGRSSSSDRRRAGPRSA